MKARTVAYWIPTALFCTVLTYSGFAHFTHEEAMVESMRGLGYPLYFMTIIGAAKLLGVVALLAPRLAQLKEWAYAGFAFNLIGATSSHVFAGDPIQESVGPFVLLIVCAASYLMRPADRRLPTSPAWATPEPSTLG